MEPSAQNEIASENSGVLVFAPEPSAPRQKRRKSMARRSGQDGVVEKKGHFWYGRYYEDVPGQVERRRVAVRLGLRSELTKPEAKRMLKDVIHKAGVNTAEHLERSKVFKDITDWWIINKLSFSKPSTQQAAQNHLNAHILPFFGELALVDITEQKVQEFVRELANKTYRRNVNSPVKHLSPKSIRNVLGILRLILGRKHWQDWSLTLPKPTRHEQRWFSREEMLAIVNAAKGKEKVLFNLLAGTGMRAGEAFALYVPDIDLERGVITIQRASYKGVEGTPKTLAGFRRVNIDADLVAVLRAYIGTRTTGRLFSTRNGKPLQKDSVRKSLQSILRRLNLPEAGLHSFRHGRVSWLNMQGCPGDLIRAWVGHSNLKVTSIYTHFDETFRTQAANSFGLNSSVRPNRPNEEPETAVDIGTQSVNNQVVGTSRGVA